MPSFPPSTPLPRAAPETKGVDAGRILGFLDAVAEAGIELHSFMLFRAGAVVAEGFWRPYAAHRPHMLHSATKSWTATAIGLAIDQGLLALDDKVAKFFPEHMPPDPGENLLAMTVRDLLTMRTGHASGISGGEWRGLRTSWVRAFLHEAVPDAPGERFIYSSASSYVLSAIVTKVTGQTAHDFLDGLVFRPLGMASIAWDLSPEGVSTGGNGLSCTTEDAVRFAVLHLQGGLWQGARILPRAWVAEATHPHVAEARLGVMDGKRYAAPSATDGPKRLGYGYHWWMTPFGGYRASGIFGQHAIVLPHHDAVIAFTAALRPGDSRLLDLAWAHLVPALEGGDSAAGGDLSARLAALALPVLPDGVAGPSLDRTYDVAPNNQGVSRLAVAIDGTSATLTLTDARGTHAIAAGFGHDIEADTTMTGNALHHAYQPDRLRVVARAAWQDADTLRLTWRFVETVFCDTVLLKFDPHGVTMRRSVNTNAGLMELPELVGTRTGSSLPCLVPKGLTQPT
jgi:CubicO group peptidase (beta-lactamase class C family)